MDDAVVKHTLDRLEELRRGPVLRGGTLVVMPISAADLALSTLTMLADELCDARLAAEGWERECRRLRERWCLTIVGRKWCALRRNEQQEAKPWKVYRTVCGLAPNSGEKLPGIEHREPSCPDCREVLCLDQ